MATREELLKVMHKIKAECNIKNISDSEMLDVFLALYDRYDGKNGQNKAQSGAIATEKPQSNDILRGQNGL